MFKSSFLNPPYEFYPVPWWAWTGIMRRSEMKKQMQSMAEQKIHEFFIFAVYGLEKPQFLSDEYFELVRFTLDYAEKLNMKVWIYDDFNWPSGTGGGQFLREHPESRAWLMAGKNYTLNPGQSVNFEFEVLYSAVLKNGVCQPVEIKKSVRGYEYFNNSELPVNFFAVQKEPYEATIVGSNGGIWSYGQRGILDSLSSKSVKKWLNFTYEKYYKKLGEYFGSTLKGFFFDEPQARPRQVLSAPFTEGIFEDFEKRFGYDLKLKLGELFFNSPDSDLVRANFWSLISEYFSMNFAGEITKWCREHQVISSGHCVDEESINQKIQVASNGDIAKVLSQLEMPGMDLLRDVSFYQDDSDSAWRRNSAYTDSLLVTAKRISGVMRWNGRRRCMCEAFGIRDWNCNFEQQKRTVDFLCGCGINFINDNSLIYSISDFRKRAISGKHFTQPWWPYYKNFMDYGARLSCFAASGVLDVKVAVLFPSELNYMSCELGNENPVAQERNIALLLNGITAFLNRHHIDYELVFESLLSKEQLKNAGIKVLIVPVQAATGLDLQKIIPESQIVVIKTPEDFGKLNDLTDLPDYKITGMNHELVLSALRLIESGHYLFLANMQGGVKSLNIEVKFSGYPELMYPESGIVKPLTIDGGKFDLSLAENESVIIHFAPKVKKSKLTAQENPVIKQLVVKSEWKFNALNDNCTFPELMIYPEQSSFSIPHQHDVLSMAFSVYEAAYFHIEGSFNLDFSIKKLKMFFDDSRVKSLKINGVTLNKGRKETLYDHENIAFDIAEFCRKGENKFNAKIKNSQWHNEKFHMAFSDRFFDLPILHGDFSLDSNGTLIERTNKIQLGDWSEAGYGFYAGVGVYECDFDFSGNLLQSAALDIGEFSVTAEVELNSVCCGTKIWRGGVFDITNLLKKGNNHLKIKISNSLGNLLRRGFDGRTGMIQKAGLTGPVKIIYQERG